jgi:hypothetical protein
VSTFVDYGGRTVGNLTVMESIGRHGDSMSATLQWRCRCVCGNIVVRSGRSIARAQRHGDFRKMQCPKCGAIARAAFRTKLHDIYVARMRTFWDKYGSLWSSRAVDQLYIVVDRAFASKYGPIVDTYNGPTDVDLSYVWTPPDRPEGGCLQPTGHGQRDRDGMSLAEVGKHFGVTRERIRQIESQAMWKLVVGLFRVDPDLFGGVCPSRASVRASLRRREHDETERERQRRQAARLAAATSPRQDDDDDGADDDAA